MNFTSNQQLIHFLIKHKSDIEFVRANLYSDEYGNPHDEITLLFYKRGLFEKILDFFFETSPIGISLANYLSYSKLNLESLERFEIKLVNEDGNSYKKPAQFLIKLFMKNSIYAD
jgi:hypothetical protein